MLLRGQNPLSYYYSIMNLNTTISLPKRFEFECCIGFKLNQHGNLTLDIFCSFSNSNFKLQQHKYIYIYREREREIATNIRLLSHDVSHSKEHHSSHGVQKCKKAKRQKKRFKKVENVLKNDVINMV